jgi:N-acylneuraminate cytidylyltransferase
MIALIPARAGSKRCSGKNTRLLRGHPLIAYTIAAAQQSGVFADVIVCTDNTNIRQWIGDAVTVQLRTPVSDCQPDIEWVRVTLACHATDAFAILRPTSPFRTFDTIRRAYEQFQLGGSDSIRAVEPVKQTPYKMWRIEKGLLKPLVDQWHVGGGPPYHSSPTQTLPVVWIQNSSLEMGLTTNVTKHGTIHGRSVAPFYTTGHEGFAIDTEDDWRTAESIARAHPELLPSVDVARVSPALADDDTSDHSWAI